MNRLFRYECCICHDGVYIDGDKEVWVCPSCLREFCRTCKPNHIRYEKNRWHDREVEICM